MTKSASFIGNKVILYTRGRLCESPEDLIKSDLFLHIINGCIDELKKRESLLLRIFNNSDASKKNVEILIKTLQHLVHIKGDLVINIVPGAEQLFRDKPMLSDFCVYLYNYWRGHERYIIFDSEDDIFDKRPYRNFNKQIQNLTSLIRSTFRDIRENITGSHPRIYRQLSAGAKVAAICLKKEVPFNNDLYLKLNRIKVIRQLLLYPTLILDPPMNKRKGKFVRIDQNPLGLVDLNPHEWLCYPAKVGKLLVNVYFHEKFYELGFSLSNLFELADDEDLMKTPDAVYLFGVPGNCLDGTSEFPTVFFDDEDNNILVGACPGRDEFGYFGYLKKMMLTLHNIKMMKEGRMPFHGALVQVYLKNGVEATILFIGDSGAGKSETLEAFRIIGDEMIRDMLIIADDMGSLDIDEEGNVVGYGTEIGAFIRLDDIKPGYAFRKIDRSIIMSPGKTNARIVLPVTTLDIINRGHTVEYVFYVNNYDEIDDEHPILERFHTSGEAYEIFKEGKVMSKGTTTSKGIVNSYFANIFGPPQYRELHDVISKKFFEIFFEKKVFIGQLRTRLGIPGWEMAGPEKAARLLLEAIIKDKNIRANG